MSNMNFSQALNDALKVEMTRDPNIYVAGEDVGVYGGIFGVTAGLLDQFGDKRVKDTPITESAIVGTAVGAATVGLRPVIELMFVDFIGVALDQLYNQAGCQQVYREICKKTARRALRSSSSLNSQNIGKNIWDYGVSGGCIQSGYRSCGFFTGRSG